MATEHWNRATQQANYLNEIDYSDPGRVMIEVGQGIIWALLAIAEAVDNHGV
jgi:hypothetical protein